MISQSKGRKASKRVVQRDVHSLLLKNIRAKTRNYILGVYPDYVLPAPNVGADTRPRTERAPSLGAFLQKPRRPRSQRRRR